MRARPHPQVSGVFDSLLRHKYTGKHRERGWILLTFLVTVQVVAAGSMREWRDVQRHLHLIECNFNLAGVDERLREAAKWRVVEQAWQRTAIKTRNPIEVVANVTFGRRLLLNKMVDRSRRRSCPWDDILKYDASANTELAQL